MNLLLPSQKTGVVEHQTLILGFTFVEIVQVELSHKTTKLLETEMKRDYILLHFGLVFDNHTLSSAIPTDNLIALRILTKWVFTSRIKNSLLRNLLIFLSGMFCGNYLNYRKPKIF